jgi:molybdopterin converting factor small subunit
LTTLRIPAPLQPLTSGATEVRVEAQNIAEALANLTNQHPALRRHLFDDGGVLRGFVNVYLNQEDVRFLSGPATVIKHSDVITIVPSVAGG